MDLESRFISEMVRLGCSDGKLCLIALSGGSDSVALLQLCARTREQTGNSYIAVRVRHGIRSDGIEDKETAFCTSLCRSLEIPFFASGADEVEGPDDIARQNGCGPEQAAREFRYQVLEKIKTVEQQEFILLAHTLDDNRETLIMRVFSGSGPEGLKGIPEKRRALRRPLLLTDGYELKNYLEQLNTQWCEDASNSGNRYLRNKVRNRLIPLITEIFPGWQNAADTLIGRSKQVNESLEKELERSLTHGVAGENVYWLQVNWNSASSYIRSMAILQAINRIEGKASDSRRISWKLITELRRAADRSETLTTGGYRIAGSGDKIHLGRATKEWEGRIIIQNMHQLNNLAFTTGQYNVVAGIDTAGVQIIVNTEYFPIEFSWKEETKGLNLTLSSLNFGWKENIYDSEMVVEMPDADSDIVYIQIMNSKKSEGPHA